MAVASSMLLSATPIPLDCAVRRLAICLPAASSEEELMRLPVARRSIEVDRESMLVLMALTAAIEALLVLIDNMILLLGINRLYFDTL
ncbi:hypothetical protein D3C73_1030600 [compost metagenome]